jgi:glucan-binding YG repeat protein
MLKRINKIIGLLLIATCIITTIPVIPFNKIANAAENSQVQEINIGNKINSVALASSAASPTDEQIFYVIKGKLDQTYAQQNGVVLASPTPTKTVPLVVSYDTATKIATATTTDSFVKEQMIGQYKQSHGGTIPDAMAQYINNLPANDPQMIAARAKTIEAVAGQLQTLDGTSMPIYAYKVVSAADGTTVIDQGYFVGGKVGYMLMQKQGKPVMVSASALDNTVIGQLVSQVTDKINVITDKVTGDLDKLSDSMNDLTDSLNDKSDDVDEAWDKVFDRFDNSEGWGKRDGYRYYYDKDGVSLKGVQKIKGKIYYFNRIDGAMETGWQIVDGKRCFFDKKKGYQVFNQWIEDNGDKYFVGEDGTVKKMEFVKVNGKTYYVKADGKMAKDWFKVEDYWYYFNEDGSMATSIWKLNKDKWHYLKEDGKSAIGWLKLVDKWYYLKDPTAELQIGWFRADGSWYYSDSDGSMKTGWATSSDGWCYLDDITGKMKKNEWVTVEGNTYYFNVNGIMVTGSRYINGTKYVFNSEGILR